VDQEKEERNAKGKERERKMSNRGGEEDIKEQGEGEGKKLENEIMRRRKYLRPVGWQVC
jgi:hypothetical protein